MENRTVIYKDQAIPFVLIRKDIKNVNLKVCSDSTIVVSANKKVSYAFIEQLIRQKTPWILKNLQRFDEIRNNNSKRVYASGETITYLGRQYRLQVLPSENGEAVTLYQDEVRLFVHDQSDYARKEQLIELWYKEEARSIFNDSLDRMHLGLAGYGIEKPSFTIRTMKTRWGSCSWKKNKITLSTALVKTPINCIDYVILHELVHFRYRQHDSHFYNFLSSLMPDWKERKKILKLS